jgi:hypothetical protein
MGVLLMLMTIGGLLVAGVLLLIAVVTKKAWLGTFVFGGVAVWFAVYFSILFGVSVTSTDRDLALNEPKKFCGFYLDCHMHVSVKDVRRAKKIGNKIAAGEFYLVKVEVSSDAARATLGLNTVDAHVIDSVGQTYNRDMSAEGELAPQPEFEKRVGPEQSFMKEIVFDIPTDAENPRLDIREISGFDQVIEAVLVGDEDSILHKRSYFRLDTRAETATSPAL